MARYLRFYGKKRGDRRTGSSKLGSVGFGCFSAVFVLAGIGSMAWILGAFIVPDLRVNRDYVERKGRLLEKRLQEVHQDEGLSFSPQFKVRFAAGRKPITTWASYDITDLHSGDRASGQKVLDRFHEGREYPVWSDPRDPSRAVMSIGYTWYVWVALLVPISFLAVGGGGLAIAIGAWGKSAEQRSVMAQRAAKIDLFDDSASIERQFPHVPGDGDLTNSPGTTLAFRLASSSPGWNLLAMLLITLVWNSVVAAFLVMVVNQHLAGQPDWLLTLFIAPLAMVGIGLGFALGRQLLISTGVGPTIVEISKHPLLPGERYEMFFSQSGHLKVNSLAILLVCEEEATYRQGTNTRTVTRRVHEQEIFRREQFEVQKGAPFETRCSLMPPAGAMHSFRAEHNHVRWKLLVRGDIAGWPDFERSFVVHVYPPRLGIASA